MGRKVEALCINGGVTKAVLAQTASDPELDGYVVICKWKGGRFSAGWSNMPDEDLTYCQKLLDREIDKCIFGE